MAAAMTGRARTPLELSIPLLVIPPLVSTWLARFPVTEVSFHRRGIALTFVRQLPYCKSESRPISSTTRDGGTSRSDDDAGISRANLE